MTYDEACRRAATNQGLDPIISTLDYCGVAHRLEQTGGFCMVVAIPTADGTYAVTSDHPTDILVGYYTGDTWLNGESAGDEPMWSLSPAAFNLFCSALAGQRITPTIHPTSAPEA